MRQRPQRPGSSGPFLLKLLLCLLLVADAADASLPQGVVFTEPILRSIPIVTGKLNATAAKAARESATGRQTVDKLGPRQSNIEHGETHSKESRTLYTNDGHSNRMHSGHVAPNSWEDLDQGVFPQRNYEYPE